MTRAKSVHAQVQTEFKACKHATQLTSDPTAFSFFLDLSHFILIPPVCFFYHLSLCVFLSLLPICSRLCCCLLLCLSVSLRLSDLSSVKSSLHLDSQSLMGTRGGVRDKRSAVYWGKILLKESKGWEHKAWHVCVPAGFKWSHFNSHHK